MDKLHLTILIPIADIDAPHVQGDIEEDELVRKLPVKHEIVMGHCKIGVMHNLRNAHNRVKVARLEFLNTLCVVFGHGHIPWIEENYGLLLFNPESATDQRRQPRCSVGLLYVDEEAGSVSGEIIWL
jgi:predicted phosphodiesterase